MPNYLDTLLAGAGGGLVPPGPAMAQAPQVQAQPMVAPPQQPEQPLPSPVRPGPPSNPQEMQERQSGWATLMQKLETDPTYSTALMRLGTNLMQPVAQGQTPLGQSGLAIQDAMNYFTFQQGERRRAGLDVAESQRRERGVNVAERREATGERVAESQIQSADVQRRGEEQRIKQNEKLYPMTLKKMQQEIDASVSRGIVDEAQAEFLRQRARLYPAEVAAEINRAEAQARAAGKPGEYDILQAVAAATAKAEGISPDEALAKLGGARYGKSSGAGAQTLIQQERIIRSANPKQEGETPEAWNQRISAILQKQMQTAKGKDREESRIKFITDNPYMARSPQEAAKMFDEMYPGGEGSAPPAAAPLPGKSSAIKYPYAPAVEQRKPGTTYDTPRGPMKWTGTGWVPL